MTLGYQSILTKSNNKVDLENMIGPSKNSYSCFVKKKKKIRQPSRVIVDKAASFIETSSSGRNACFFFLFMTFGPDWTVAIQRKSERQM